MAHSTLFKPRPGTRDKVDRMEQRHQIMENLLPPVIYRRLDHRLRKLGI